MDSHTQTKPRQRHQSHKTDGAVNPRRETHLMTTQRPNGTQGTRDVHHNINVSEVCAVDSADVPHPAEAIQARRIKAPKTAWAETLGLCHQSDSNMKSLLETNPKKKSRAHGEAPSTNASPSEEWTAPPSLPACKAEDSCGQPRPGDEHSGCPENCKVHGQLVRNKLISRQTASVVARWVKHVYSSSGPNIKFAAFLCSTCADPVVVEAFNSTLTSCSTSCVSAHNITIFTPFSYTCSSDKSDSPSQAACRCCPPADCPRSHSAPAKEENAEGPDLSDTQTNESATCGVVTDETSPPLDRVGDERTDAKRKRADVSRPGGTVLQPSKFHYNRFLQEIYPAGEREIKRLAGKPTGGTAPNTSDPKPPTAGAETIDDCSVNPDKASHEDVYTNETLAQDVQVSSGPLPGRARSVVSARGAASAPLGVGSQTTAQQTCLANAESRPTCHLGVQQGPLYFVVSDKRLGPPNGSDSQSSFPKSAGTAWTDPGSVMGLCSSETKHSNSSPASCCAAPQKVKKASAPSSDILQPIWELLLEIKCNPSPWFAKKLRSKLQSSECVDMLENLLRGKPREKTKYPHRVYEACGMINNRRKKILLLESKSGMKKKKNKGKGKFTAQDPEWNSTAVGRKPGKLCTEPAPRRDCGYQLRTLIPPPQPVPVTETSEVAKPSQASQEACTDPGASGDTFKKAKVQAGATGDAPASKLHNEEKATSSVDREQAADCRVSVMGGQGDAQDAAQKRIPTKEGKSDDAKTGVVQKKVKASTPKEISSESPQTTAPGVRTGNGNVQTLSVSVDGINDQAAKNSQKDSKKKTKGKKAAKSKGKGKKYKNDTTPSIKPKPVNIVSKELETRQVKCESSTNVSEIDVVGIDENEEFGDMALAAKKATQDCNVSLLPSREGDNWPMQKDASQSGKVINDVWEVKWSSLPESSSSSSDAGQGQVATNHCKDNAASDCCPPSTDKLDKCNDQGKVDLCVVLGASDAYLIRDDSVSYMSSDEGRSDQFNTRHSTAHRKQNATVAIDEAASPMRDSYSSDEVYPNDSKARVRSAAHTKASQAGHESSAARMVKEGTKNEFRKRTTAETHHKPTDFNRRQQMYTTIPPKSSAKHVGGRLKTFAKTKKNASSPKLAQRIKNWQRRSSSRTPRAVKKYHPKLQSTKLVHRHVCEECYSSDHRSHFITSFSESRSHERKHAVTHKGHPISGKQAFPCRVNNWEEVMSLKKRKRLTHEAYPQYTKEKRFKDNADWSNVTMQGDVKEARAIRRRKRRRTLSDFSSASSGDSRKPGLHFKKIKMSGNSQVGRCISKGKIPKPSPTPSGNRGCGMGTSFPPPMSKCITGNVLTPRLKKWTMDSGDYGSKASSGDLANEASLMHGGSTRDTVFVLGKNDAQTQQSSPRLRPGTFQDAPTKLSSTHPQISHGLWANLDSSSGGQCGSKRSCFSQLYDDFNRNYELLLNNDVVNPKLPLADLNTNNNCDEGLLDGISIDGFDDVSIDDDLLLMDDEDPTVYDRFLKPGPGLSSCQLTDGIGEGSRDVSHCGLPSSVPAKDPVFEIKAMQVDPATTRNEHLPTKVGRSSFVDEPAGNGKETWAKSRSLSSWPTAENRPTPMTPARTPDATNPLMPTRNDDSWLDACTSADSEEFCKGSKQPANDFKALTPLPETVQRPLPEETDGTQRQMKGASGSGTMKSSLKNSSDGTPLIHLTASPRGSKSAPHVPGVCKTSTPLLQIPSSGAKPSLAMNKALLETIKMKIDEFLFNSRKLRVGICKRLRKKTEGTMQKHPQAPTSTGDVKNAQCASDPKSSFSSMQMKPSTVNDTNERNACTGFSPTTTVDTKTTQWASTMTSQSSKQFNESTVDDSHLSSALAPNDDVRRVLCTQDSKQTQNSRIGDTHGTKPYLAASLKTRVGTEFTKCNLNASLPRSKQVKKPTMTSVDGLRAFVCSANTGADGLVTNDTTTSVPSPRRSPLKSGRVADFQRKRQASAVESSDYDADCKRRRFEAAEISDEVNPRGSFLDLQLSDTSHNDTEDTSESPSYKKKKLQEHTSSLTQVYGEESPSACEQVRLGTVHTLAEKAMSKGLTCDKPAKVSAVLRLGRRVDPQCASLPVSSTEPPGCKRIVEKTREKPARSPLADDQTGDKGDPVTAEANDASSTDKPSLIQRQPQAQGHEEMQTDERKIVLKRNFDTNAPKTKHEATLANEGTGKAPHKVVTDSNVGLDKVQGEASKLASLPATTSTLHGTDSNTKGEEFNEIEPSHFWSWWEPYPWPKTRFYPNRNLKWIAQHIRQDPKEYADFELKEIMSRQELLQDLTTSNFKKERLQSQLLVSHCKFPPRFLGLARKVRACSGDPSIAMDHSYEEARNVIWQKLLMAERAEKKEIGTFRSRLAENYDEMLEEMLRATRPLLQNGACQKDAGKSHSGGDPNQDDPCEEQERDLHACNETAAPKN